MDYHTQRLFGFFSRFSFFLFFPPMIIVVFLLMINPFYSSGAQLASDIRRTDTSLTTFEFVIFLLVGWGTGKENGLFIQSNYMDFNRGNVKILQICGGGMINVPIVYSSVPASAGSV